MDQQKLDETRESLESSAKGYTRALDAIDLARALGGEPTAENHLALKEARFYLHTCALVYADTLGTDRPKSSSRIFKLLLGKKW